MPPSAMPPLSIPDHSLAGYRVHTLLCRGSGLPICFLLSSANVHDAPFLLVLVLFLRIVVTDASPLGCGLIRCQVSPIRAINHSLS